MKSGLTRHGTPLPWIVLVGAVLLDLVVLWWAGSGLRVADDRGGWLAAWPLGAGLLSTLALAGLLQWHMSRRQHAEAAMSDLSADVRLLALVARSTTNAVVVTDVDGLVTWVNEAYERTTGFTLAESLGRKPGEMLQFEDTDRITVGRIRAALSARAPFQGDLLNRSKDGRVYWIHLDIQPLTDALGQPAGFIGINSDVTDRRETEQALRVSQAFLHNTGRIAGVGGWEFDPASGHVELTEQARRILDMDLGQQVAPDDALALVAPSARERIGQLLAGGLDGVDDEWDVEVPVITRAGRHLWLRVLAEGQFGDHGLMRIAGAVQDVTARRQVEADAVRSAQLLRDAIDAIDEAFALYDPDDRLVLCNEKYLQLYETSRDLIVPGARFEDILRGGVARGQYAAAQGDAAEDWIQRRLASHRSGDRALVQRLDSGRIVRVVDRLTDDGHRVGFRFDITELVQATEAAERADAAKSAFIATISHELRTPLQSVIGFSELGRHFAADQPQFVQMFDDILSGGQRMLTLVNDLLDISKIDGSIGSLTLRRGDLVALAAEVVQEFAPQLAARQLTLHWPEPRPRLDAEVDAFRIQQVVRNVLANAVRFAPAGSRIDIDAREDLDAGIVLAVRDQGPGIPPDELESIFEPFVQSSRTRDGSGGTGLGLAICRKIVGAHGGRIEAACPEGGGALIRLWLPAAVSSPARAGGGRLLRSTATAAVPAHAPTTAAATATATATESATATATAQPRNAAQAADPAPLPSTIGMP